MCCAPLGRVLRRGTLQESVAPCGAKQCGGPAPWRGVTVNGSAWGFDAETITAAALWSAASEL